MENPICSIHNKSMTLKPAGISKAGKSYPAFWSCGEKNPNGTYCAYRPPANTPTQGRQVAMPKFEAELRQSDTDKRIEKYHDEKTENIARSVSLNNATELMTEAMSHYTRFGDFGELLKELYNVADKNYEWLTKG